MHFCKIRSTKFCFLPRFGILSSFLTFQSCQKAASFSLVLWLHLTSVHWKPAQIEVKPNLTPIFFSIPDPIFCVLFLGPYCLTELFPIYQNNIWTIRWWDDHTIIPLQNTEDCRIYSLYNTKRGICIQFLPPRRTRSRTFINCFVLDKLLSYKAKQLKNVLGHVPGRKNQIQNRSLSHTIKFFYCERKRFICFLLKQNMFLHSFEKYQEISVKSMICKHQDTCTVNINAMATHLKGWLDFVATFFYLLFLLFSTLCHNLSPCFAKKSRVQIMCLLF